MIDRGIIKWQPFDSCYSGSKILKDINNEKNREIFPTLSEDQLCILEEKITNAYHLGEFINIEYFYNGKINKLKGKINFINLRNKKIYINENIIYFSQIIKVI